MQTPPPHDRALLRRMPLGARSFLLAGLALFCTSTARAQNPLNLTPGTAATVTLGSITNLAQYNTSIATSDISYSNTDLAARQYVVRLPAGFDAADSSKKYGLVSYIDSGDTHAFPASYAAVLDTYGVIWLGGRGIGNAQNTNLRRGVATMGAYRLTELYPAIDRARIFASGLSGGSRTASDLAYLRSDFFRGFIGRVGSSLPGIIPGWECAGTNSTNADADYEYMSTNAADPSVVLPPYFRTAIMTQYGDFRRAENLAIYRYGHLNHGNTVRGLVRPGGHSDEVGANFTDAVHFLHHPLVDVIWDRFENGVLGANVQPGKIVAGAGFAAIAGSVSETTYTFNSSTHGVLQLSGDGAAARAADAFAWKNVHGALIDARLRSRLATTAGQNQRIGLHVVAASASGTPATQPGFHLYWNYGEPHRTELVAADGTVKTLATWQHPGTHPMALAANDKTFWGDVAAPDFAGRTKAFRGEDVRLALSSVGFQLTFNRPAASLVTTYPGVVLTSADASTPFAENIPVILQGFWSEVETSLVNALPAGDYRLVLTNDAIVSGQPVGDAVVDEIRLVAAAGLQAAPPTLAVTAPANGQRLVAWTRTPGAMGYRIQRAAGPDDVFADLPAATTLANTLASYTDATASSTNAYYYRVAALGSDGGTGRWSPVSFAARTGTTPAAPTGLSATPGPFQVTLAWTDAAATETSYRVERSPAGFASWTLLTGSLAANSTTFVDLNADAATGYDYRVSALNAAGLSAFASVTTVTSFVTPLQAWRHAAFGTASATGDAADLADPDHDGAPNLLEYALGTIPTNASSVAFPIPSTSNLKLQLTFVRSRPDVSYIVEAAADLAAPGNWSVLATNPGAVGDTVTVVDTVSLSSTSTSRFLRLRVTSP